jgi:hypothetical protein
VVEKSYPAVHNIKFRSPDRKTVIQYRILEKYTLPGGQDFAEIVVFDLLKSTLKEIDFYVHIK